MPGIEKSFEKHLFDQTKPYQSIIDFTNRSHNLTARQKKEWFLQVEKFFEGEAYNDRERQVPDDFAKRFREIDVQTLSNIANVVDPEEGEDRTKQLLANISKVAKISLGGGTDEASIYQLIVTNVDGDNKTLYWGWIEGRYLDSSEALKQKIQSGRVVIDNKEMTPSILVALQRWQTLVFEQEKRNVILDLSFDEFDGLIKFALKWKIKEFLTEVEVALDKDTLICEEQKEHQSSIFQSETLSQLKSFGGYCRRYKLWNVKTLTWPDSQDDTLGISEYFDKENPFTSIKKFTERSCTLSRGEQSRFFSSVRRFFTELAYRHKTLSIPAKMQNSFASVSLPFLLETMHHHTFERLRLLADIHQVTESYFPQLKQANQIVLVKNRYSDSLTQAEQIGWVRRDDMPDIEERLCATDSGIMAPLKYFEMQGGASLDFANLNAAGNKSIGNLENPVAAFLLGVDYGIKRWKSRAREDIDQIFRDKHSSIVKISWELAKHLHRNEVRTLVEDNHNDFSYGMSNYIMPKLSEEELYHLLDWVLEKGVNSCQLASLGDEILNPLEKLINDNLGNKKKLDKIKGFWSRLLPGQLECPFERILSTSQSSPRLSILEGVELEEFHLLKDERVIRLCKMMRLDDDRVYLHDTHLAVEFTKKFFPEKMGKAKTDRTWGRYIENIRDDIRILFKIATEKSLGWELSIKKATDQCPWLSNQDNRTNFLDVLQTPDCSKWFEEHAAKIRSQDLSDFVKDQSWEDD